LTLSDPRLDQAAVRLMPHPLKIAVLGSLLNALFLSVAFGQGYPPGEAARHMTVPEGLAVELVAAEPVVRQPVAIEFDDRGRLWVIQYLQYPNPEGLSRVAVDRYSRTKYDRMPEPPPRGPRGADRITILEDADRDGRAERGKDFVAGLNLASGLAFGHGGVFVLQVPYLLFYADRDRDDVPDGDPQVLLTGFGMEDAHSVANSLTWGPDGWLYGCQGSTVTSTIRGIEFQQGVWRYHPISHAFELFCEGGGNSWGLDFDARGQLFYATNYGGYAMLHGLQGAYYWKQFGKHGALHNPYAYGYFDHVPHQDLRGGHVTVGGIIYQGDLLPEAFRGKYIAADLLGHAAYWHTLERRGSTFSARQSGDLLLASDTWFAPSDLTMGPDGAIYLCDWHDARTAHPDPDADWDRRNGRIYRIAPRGAKRFSAGYGVDLAGASSEQLVELLSDSNDWFVRRARRMLAERGDAAATEILIKRLRDARDPQAALQTLWAIYGCGGWSDELAAELLAHPSEDVRSWTVRLLGDAGQVSPQLARRFAALAADDPSVTVRAQLACTAKRLPAEQSLPIIAKLIRRDEDAADPYLPLLTWWAVERRAVDAREQTLAVFTDADVWRHPLAAGTILPRLIRRYAAEATEAGYLACATLLEVTPEDRRAAMLAALDEGLKDRNTEQGGNAGTLFTELTTAAPESRRRDAKPPSVPERLLAHVRRDWRDDTTDLALVRLAARLGNASAQRRAAELATDIQRVESERIAALAVVAEVGATDNIAALLALVESDASAAVRLAACDALGRFDDPRIADTLLERWGRFDDRLQAKVCDLLLGRKASAAVLLACVDRGEVPAEKISVDQLRLVALHQDAGLDALVKKHWGTIQRGTPEQRLAEIRRISNDLRAGSGDLASGRALFAKHCGTCHKLFDEGNAIGPELTHANRHKTPELLAAIVDPSAMIRKEYMNFLLQTTDGRVLIGLLVEQTPGSVTLVSAKNERTTIPRDEIETLSEADVSLMPENLLKELKPQELRDLVGYLQSDPATPPSGGKP